MSIYAQIPNETWQLPSWMSPSCKSMNRRDLGRQVSFKAGRGNRLGSKQCILSSVFYSFHHLVFLLPEGSIHLWKERERTLFPVPFPSSFTQGLDKVMPSLPKLTGCLSRATACFFWPQLLLFSPETAVSYPWPRSKYPFHFLTS